MTKKVRYNGGTLSYYGCTKPKDLVKGAVYEVVSENDRGFQTDYTLRGVVGYFTSTWFDDVTSSNNVYMAIARTIPMIGKEYTLYKLEFVSGTPKFLKKTTSSVKKTDYLGNNIYMVTTLNSIYVVNVK